MGNQEEEVPHEQTPQESEMFGLGTVDWFLMELVEFAEIGFRPHLVLTVGGAHVSGRLMSAEAYFNAMADLFRRKDNGPQNTGSAALNALADRFAQHAVLAQRPADTPVGNVRRYIHLEDARFHTTDGKTLPSKGVIQRFRLTAVDGFSFGELRSTGGLESD